MAKLITSFASGGVDEGETKTLGVAGKASDQSVITPSSLTATFTPPAGDPATYELGAFTLVDGVYYVDHKFDSEGVWKIEVKAVDAGGRIEIETYRQYVRPK